MNRAEEQVIVLTIILQITNNFKKDCLSHQTEIHPYWASGRRCVQVLPNAKKFINYSQLAAHRRKRASTPLSVFINALFILFVTKATWWLGLVPVRDKKKNPAIAPKSCHRPYTALGAIPPSRKHAFNFVFSKRRLINCIWLISITMIDFLTPARVSKKTTKKPHSLCMFVFVLRLHLCVPFITSPPPQQHAVLWFD